MIYGFPFTDTDSTDQFLPSGAMVNPLPQDNLQERSKKKAGKGAV